MISYRDREKETGKNENDEWGRIFSSCSIFKVDILRFLPSLSNFGAPKYGGTQINASSCGRYNKPASQLNSTSDILTLRGQQFSYHFETKTSLNGAKMARNQIHFISVCYLLSFYSIICLAVSVYFFQTVSMASGSRSLIYWATSQRVYVACLSR